MDAEMIPHDEALDAALIRLSESIGDLATMTSILLSLQRNLKRLETPLTTVLIETRDIIDETLSILENRPCR
jgi:hypothetical protein